MWEEAKDERGPGWQAGQLRAGEVGRHHLEAAAAQGDDGDGLLLYKTRAVPPRRPLVASAAGPLSSSSVLPVSCTVLHPFSRCWTAVVSTNLASARRRAVAAAAAVVILLVFGYSVLLSPPNSPSTFPISKITMHAKQLLSLGAAAAALLFPLAGAAAAVGDETPSSLGSDSGGTGPDADGKYWIYGNGIAASFIPYGASVSNLLVHDQYGIVRDLVGGFDNASYYSVDRQHPHFGGVPGRYANRIKNSSFVLDGTTYDVLPNENPEPGYPNGVDTLHGGPDGWDWRNFTVVAHTGSSIVFKLVDPDGDQGFPGEVVAYITYTLGDHSWGLHMLAVPTTKPTPIMLSSHTYWNLDGFANNETNLVLNHSLHLPYSGQRVATDTILIPTGDILANQAGSVNDFWTAPKQIGANFTNPDLLGNCGYNCTGYDTCYLVNHDLRGPDDYVARLHSPWSGIQLDVYTEQEAFQVYSCGGQNGSMALKKTQGLFGAADGSAPLFPRTIPQYGCVVLEVEDWIDGINQPEWGRQDRQIFAPGDAPYELQATYKFSINTAATPV